VTLRALTPREASIFACVCDTVVAPEPALPAVRETDAVSAFDAWLAHAPRLNRIGLRALLYAAELAPRMLGFPGRLRRLDSSGRGEALAAAERAGSHHARQVVKLVEGLAFLSYYGDDRVMLRLGYDAEANLRRARKLRTAELRP
jgi:hypothetical protein